MPARFTSRQTLRARAAVDHDGGDAGVLERAGEIGRGEILVVPAKPHFAGDRNLDGVDHAGNQRGGSFEFGHHRRAAADLADLADGTTHVDIDRDYAFDFKNCAAAAISSGTAPNSCTAMGLSAGELSISLSALRFFSMSERALTRSVVHSPTPPISRMTQPKWQIGITGQRREKEIRFKSERSELKLCVLRDGKRKNHAGLCERKFNFTARGNDLEFAGLERLAFELAARLRDQKLPGGDVPQRELCSM